MRNKVEDFVLRFAGSLCPLKLRYDCIIGVNEVYVQDCGAVPHISTISKFLSKIIIKYIQGDYFGKKYI
jgi:hypothetical protein